MQIQRGAAPVEHIKVNKNTPLELYFSKANLHIHNHFSKKIIH